MKSYFSLTCLRPRPSTPLSEVHSAASARFSSDFSDRRIVHIPRQYAQPPGLLYKSCTNSGHLVPELALPVALRRRRRDAASPLSSQSSVIFFIPPAHHAYNKVSV